jgi:hypothetical protein
MRALFQADAFAAAFVLFTALAAPPPALALVLITVSPEKIANAMAAPITLLSMPSSQIRRSLRLSPVPAI